MKKKARKIVVCVMVVMSIFAVCSTAFAVGETLSHSGTSKPGYYTTNSVPQKHDPYLKCQAWTTNPSSATMRAYPVYKKNDVGNWIQIVDDEPARYGTKFELPSHNDLWHVHLRIMNVGSYQGYSVYSSGNWQLVDA